MADGPQLDLEPSGWLVSDLAVRETRWVRIAVWIQATLPDLLPDEEAEGFAEHQR